MPHISALKQSKFLTRNDVGRGALVTIKSIGQENVAKEGAPEELKWCMWLEQFDKPLVLNATNGQIIASITGSELTEDWIGHQIVLYDDPNVSFGGKLVGGIRCRAPRQTPKTAPRANPAPPRAVPVAPPTPQRPGPEPEPEYVQNEPSDDDVPF